MPTNTRNLANVPVLGKLVVAANGNIAIANTTSTIAARLHIEDPVAQAANQPVLIVGDPGGSVQAGAYATGILVDASTAYGFVHKQHSATNSGIGYLVARSRGTASAETVVDDDDNLGYFTTLGYNGTAYSTTGYTGFKVDETVRSISGTNIPTEYFLVLNDGTTYVQPIGCAPSATAGYAHTTINGSATLNGQTAAAGLTVNSNGAAWSAVYAIADNDTCTAQLANDIYTFLASGGVLNQTGPAGNHASVFNSEDAAYSAVLAYSQNNTTYTQLGAANAYTMFGIGGVIENRGIDSTSGSSCMALYNSAVSELFTVRDDGLIGTGTLTFSPYNYSITGRDVYVDSNGHLGYLSSTQRHKENIVDMDPVWADKLLDMRPVHYHHIHSEFDDWNEYGLIAEEVGEIDPRYVYWDTGARPAVEEKRDPDGELVRPAKPAQSRKPQSEWVADGIDYKKFVPGLISIAKRQRDRIEALEAQVSDLTAQLTSLADRVTALET